MLSFGNIQSLGRRVGRLHLSWLGQPNGLWSVATTGRFRIQPAENPLDSPMPSSPVETLGILENPRGNRTKLHHLTDILVLSVLAVICSAVPTVS